MQAKSWSGKQQSRSKAGSNLSNRGDEGGRLGLAAGCLLRARRLRGKRLAPLPEGRQHRQRLHGPRLDCAAQGVGPARVDLRAGGLALRQLVLCAINNTTAAEQQSRATSEGERAAIRAAADAAKMQ